MSATNRGKKRNAYDHYDTPKHCVEAIARELYWGPRARFLEPCLGNGHVLSVVKPFVMTADWCEIQRGRDFLTFEPERRYDFILTNPPYSLAKEFIERSLELADCVVMLLRLNFLASRKRREWWKAHPPTAIYILSSRPSFTGDGKSDATEYCWMVWDSTGRQKKGLMWL